MVRPAPKICFNPAPLESLKPYQDDQGLPLIISLIQSFLSYASSELEQLSFCAETDPRAFIRLAHTLKSAAAALGGIEMASILADLEIRELSSVERKFGAQRAHESFQSLKIFLMEYIEQTRGEKAF